MSLHTDTVPQGPKPARRRFLWRLGGLTLVAVAGAGALAWWYYGKQPTITYTAATVDRGTVSLTVTATGTVNPELTIIVGSYVSGVIL